MKPINKKWEEILKAAMLEDKLAAERKEATEVVKFVDTKNKKLAAIELVFRYGISQVRAAEILRVSPAYISKIFAELEKKCNNFSSFSGE